MIMCPLISDRTTWSDGLVKPHKSLGVMDNVPTLLATNPTKVLSSPSNPENPNTNGPGPKLFRWSRIPTTNFTPNQSQVVQITWVNTKPRSKNQGCLVHIHKTDKKLRSV